MASPFAADPYRVPLNVLFPEQYEASKRMIVRDFALLGALIVASVVGGALLHLVLASAVA